MKATLQYCSGFCHMLTSISHECTCVPHPEPPSHIPPHPIPQGHPSTPALSTLYHASNLDWRSVSHMVIYMFQCYSLRSSHPRLLPQNPKDCSIHLCLSPIFTQWNVGHMELLRAPPPTSSSFFHCRQCTYFQNFWHKFQNSLLEQLYPVRSHIEGLTRFGSEKDYTSIYFVDKILTCPRYSLRAFWKPLKLKEWKRDPHDLDQAAVGLAAVCSTPLVGPRKRPWRIGFLPRPTWLWPWSSAWNSLGPLLCSSGSAVGSVADLPRSCVRGTPVSERLRPLPARSPQDRLAPGVLGLSQCHSSLCLQFTGVHLAAP